MIKVSIEIIARCFLILFILYGTGCKSKSNSNLVFDPASGKQILASESQTKETSKKDEQLLEAVLIGEQEWMRENLNVEKFRNGDPIPEVHSDEEWRLAAMNKQPAWCYLNNLIANSKKAGKLYNYFAVIDPRGLAPEGWRIPDINDWQTLLDVVGNDKNGSRQLKSSDGWVCEGMNGNGDNYSGFNGVAGGKRDRDGKFVSNCGLGTWWSSTKTAEDMVSTFHLSFLSDPIISSLTSMGAGASVRCLKEK